MDRTNQKSSFSPTQYSPTKDVQSPKDSGGLSRMDPPDDEPPSLKIESMEENYNLSSRNHTPGQSHVSSPSSNPDIDDQGFFRMEPAMYNDLRDETQGPDNFSSHYLSPVSGSHKFENFEPARFDEPAVTEISSPIRNDDFQIDEMSPKKRINVAHQSSGIENSGRLNQDTGEFSEGSGNIDEPPEMNGSVEEVQHDMKRTPLEQTPPRNDFETQNVSEMSYVPSDPIGDEKFNYSDEKKIGVENDEVDSDLNDSKLMIKKELATSDKLSRNDKPFNDIEPINTSYRKQNDNNATPNRFSAANATPSSVTESKGHQSPAMRGAHEILKRNRRRRAEV